MLRMIGDADGAGAAFDVNPLVLFRVLVSFLDNSCFSLSYKKVSEQSPHHRLVADHDLDRNCPGRLARRANSTARCFCSASEKDRRW